METLEAGPYLAKSKSAAGESGLKVYEGTFFRGGAVSLVDLFSACVQIAGMEPKEVTPLRKALVEKLRSYTETDQYNGIMTDPRDRLVGLSAGTYGVIDRALAQELRVEG